MEGKIFLRPGTPDDVNRDYLPESIFGSDIVVNENGNNSQPRRKARSALGRRGGYLV